MTFDSRERSADQGRPIELFTFARDYQIWRYTSADRDIIIDGATFSAKSISRSDIDSTPEIARSGIKILAPRDLEVADLYRISPPTLTVNLIVQQVHDGENDVVTIWTGRISNVNFIGLAAEITCDPVFTAVRRVGLRRLYQRQCPHVLYGSACRVQRETVRTDGVANAISGLTIDSSEASALDDGWFAGGYVEYEVELGIAERRFITDHTGTTITLSARPVGLVVGQLIKLYPGCDHTTTACVEKFDNILNYGGFPYFTRKNPFGGDPIF